MKESYIGKDDFIIEYLYSTQDSRLYIDCSDYCDDGFIWACYNDFYRVCIGENTLILHGLADMGDEPDDYCFRIILKRNKLQNRLIENFKALFLPRLSYYKAGSLL